MKTSDHVEALELELLQTLPREEGWCHNLGRVADDLEIHRELARGLLRSLRAKGDVDHWRGLMSEDGALRGSGYGLTRQGLLRIRNHEAELEELKAPRCQDCHRKMGDTHQDWCPFAWTHPVTGNTVHANDCGMVDPALIDERDLPMMRPRTAAHLEDVLGDILGPEAAR